MKIEKRKLTYFINGTKFIDLDCLGYAVQQKLFNSSSYQYLLKSHKKKGDKANLISLKVFQEILRKHSKTQPCWCLSGLNFIDCHFNKEKKVKMTHNEIYNLMKSNFSYRGCLHKNVSNCSDLIIKAHSISKKGSLEYISVDQHVYGMKFDFNGFNFSKIGIRNASTFTGFCKKHDEILFSSFEKNDFQKTSKQLFDLSYRAICIEYHSMQSIVNLLTLLKKNIDNSLDTQTQISRQIGINSQIFFYELGIKYSNYYKEKMEILYKNASHEDLLEHYIFELSDGYPKFQSSSCFNPNFDLDGNILQNLDDPHTRSKNLFVNCLTFNNRGYLILSWFYENHDFGEKIINSIINDPEKIEDKLFTLIFLYAHNTFASPKWYEELTDDQVEKIKLLQDFWIETDNFNSNMICSNFDSIKVEQHYLFRKNPTD